MDKRKGIEAVKGALEERYPVHSGQEIGVKEIDTVFSIAPHANEKYVVSPRLYCLSVMAPVLAYKTCLDIPFPMNLLTVSVIAALSLYADRAVKSSKEHEFSHSYRLRFHRQMCGLRGGEEASPFESFVNRLEEKAASSKNSVKSFAYRELAALLSIPVVVGGYLMHGSEKNKKWYWEEELAKYEAEKLSGMEVNSVSGEKREFFELLESLRTDGYVPLDDRGHMEGLDGNMDGEPDDRLRFYLEHPPAIMPKYGMIDKLYRRFELENSDKGQKGLK